MCCDGLCSFPHGPLSVWALIMSIVAYCFAINSSYGCFYVLIDVDADSPIRPVNGNSTGIGLLSYSDPLQEYFDGVQYSCVPWGRASMEYYFDHAFRAARAFGIMGDIFIGVPMITLVIMSCKAVPRTLVKIMTIAMFLGSLWEAMTFVIFASDICISNNCTFEIGAGLAIGGCVSAFVAGYLMCKCDPSGSFDIFPATGAAGLPPPGTVTVTESVEPDGTKKIVKKTVNADGSQTVEETIERPQVY